MRWGSLSDMHAMRTAHHLIAEGVASEQARARGKEVKE